MSDWQSLTLADVCAVITDGAHQSPKTVAQGKPMASVKDLTRFGVDLSSARHIAVEDFETLVRQGCKPQVGDVLIAKDGNSALDTVCTVDRPLDAVLLSSVAILRPNPAVLTSEFLKFYLSSPNVVEYLKSNFISGAAIPRVVLRDFKKAEIRLPRLSVQRSIGQTLQAIDDKIDLNRRINQTLEAMAQAIFKSWFVDFDPVKAKIAAKAEGRDPLRAAMTAISGKPAAELDTLPLDQFAPLAATAALFPDEMEDSELGEIPKEWSAAPFGSMLAHTIGGDWGSDAPDGTNDTRVAIIRGTDLPDLDQAQANRVPIRYTTQKKLANRRMLVGDIVLEVSGGSRDQPTGRSLRLTANAMREFDCPIEPASFCRLLRPVSVQMGVILGLHLSYIYQQGKTWEYQNQSTGIANFQTTHFLESELVARPPTAVADAFFKLVNPILERRHDPQGSHLAELRDTLLPKLLSGELQVHNTEAEVAA